jgi:hypothetical protein
MKTKVCSKCGDPKEYSEFPRDKSRKDGYSYNCKDCCGSKFKKYYNANKEKILKKNYSNKRDNNWYYNKDKHREAQRIQRSKLNDGYVRYLIKDGYNIDNIPIELVGLKRVQIKIRRELRKGNNENSNRTKR